MIRPTYDELLLKWSLHWCNELRDILKEKGKPNYDATQDPELMQMIKTAAERDALAEYIHQEGK